MCCVLTTVDLDLTLDYLVWNSWGILRLKYIPIAQQQTTQPHCQGPLCTPWPCHVICLNLSDMYVGITRIVLYVVCTYVHAWLKSMLARLEYEQIL